MPAVTSRKIDSAVRPAGQRPLPPGWITKYTSSSKALGRTLVPAVIQIDDNDGSLPAELDLFQAIEQDDASNGSTRPLTPNVSSMTIGGEEDEDGCIILQPHFVHKERMARLERKEEEHERRLVADDRHPIDKEYNTALMGMRTIMSNMLHDFLPKGGMKHTRASHARIYRMANLIRMDAQAIMDKAEARLTFK